MKTWIRWAAVIPSAIIAWYFAFVASLIVLTIATNMCPLEYLISGMCTAPWFPYVERAIILGGIAFSAVLVVAVPSFVAPSFRRAVAWLALLGGASAAIAIASEAGGEMRFEVASALIAGLVATLSISWFVRKHDA